MLHKEISSKSVLCLINGLVLLHQPCTSSRMRSWNRWFGALGLLESHPQKSYSFVTNSEQGHPSSYFWATQKTVPIPDIFGDSDMFLLTWRDNRVGFQGDIKKWIPELVTTYPGQLLSSLLMGFNSPQKPTCSKKIVDNNFGGWIQEYCPQVQYISTMFLFHHPAP